jgi:two-component system chemotaxis sensor kinase CheA
MRETWESLRREITELESAPLAPIFAGHAAAAEDLARELGKSVAVSLDGDDVRANPDVLDALNTAVLHALRNAVDHGIGAPEERVRAGKPLRGSVRVRWKDHGEAIEVEVTDDGDGVDFESVRQRAGRLGLLGAGSGDAIDVLADLLFAPGFSTREHVTEVSGRGVGLDAVRTAVDRLGGRARIDTVRGRGTTLRVTVPNRRARLDVRAFLPPGAQVLFAVDGAWDLEVAPPPLVSPPVDLPALLELAREPRAPSGAPPFAISFRCTGRRCRFLALAPARNLVARRLCPTPDDSPVEVLETPEGEALLIRPDALLGRENLEVADA